MSTMSIGVTAAAIFVKVTMSLNSMVTCLNFSEIYNISEFKNKSFF